MIGSAARGVAAALQEQQRLQHEERMKQHRAMLASQQQQRTAEAQVLAKARKAQKAAAAAKAEAEQQGGEGAEGFVAGAAVGFTLLLVQTAPVSTHQTPVFGFYRDVMRTLGSCTQIISLADSGRAEVILTPSSRLPLWLVSHHLSPSISIIYM